MSSPQGRHGWQVRSDTLWKFVLLNYVVMLILVWGNLRNIGGGGVVVWVYTAFAYLTYCLGYIVVPMVLVFIINGLVALPIWNFALGKGQRARDVLVWGMAILVAWAAQFFFLADSLIYRWAGFHFNGFIWNLITTKGGVESMGGGPETVTLFVLLVVGLLVEVGGLAAVAIISSRWSKVRWIWPKIFRGWVIIGLAVLVLGMGLTERVIYGVSNIKDYSPVLVASHSLAFYQPMTFRKWAKDLGVEVDQAATFDLKPQSIRLNYPLHPIELDPARKKYNIVWLVSESWRADALDPEIMPKTWAFAQQSVQFNQHYSGGNGTRMGMFTMFYGLYGSYWFPFLDERRGPMIMDLLLKDDYQIDLFTSARFTYPEFDKTLFTRIDPSRMHEGGEGEGWQFDRKNVTELLDFIDHRDKSRPFMTFMFFESPHARYYFPPESVIRKPYLEDFNYATMDLDRDIELIKNRYWNSCHHLDSQYARIIDYLREHDLLDSTIVIMTGDHGEEFMEHGKWGHGSTFSDQQTRTPLVLWVPGHAPEQVDRLTSHLDIPVTLATLLGVTNPPTDYSQGYDLLGDDVRDFTVIAHWHTLTYVDSQVKVIFPLQAFGLASSERVKGRDDEPIEDVDDVFAQRTSQFVQLMKSLSTFSR